ncbi:MAG: AMP-binding protein [Gammaproteobacteria bacterium]|nr:AMP-binding protein [Gammaproteobacteria bacterium]
MPKLAISHGEPLSLPKEYNTLGEMLLYVKNTFPDHGLTFVDISGKEEFFSYPDLVDQATQCLYHLQQQGLKPGDLLIVIIDNNLQDFYVHFWACILGGIVPAPITQPSFEKDSVTLLKLYNVWNTLNKPKLLVENKYIKYFEGLQSEDRFSGLSYFTSQSFRDGQQKISENHIGHPTDLAILQFSSGSTGDPKGVQLSHKNIICNLTTTRNSFGLTSEDKVFSWVPHTHDMGLFLQYLTSVTAGCNIYIFSPMTFSRSPYLFLKKVSEHKGAFFSTPNFGLDWMIKNIPDEKLDSLDLSTLKFILNGAEPISSNVINRFAQKFQRCGYSQNKMLAAYGMAEATAMATHVKLGLTPPVEKVDRIKLLNESVAITTGPDEVNSAAEFVHVGFPVQGVSIRIADSDGNTGVENQVGEIQVKGEQVTSGYFNRPDLLNEMFDGEWLKTGDLGFITNGSLVVTGRMKDIIFVRGKNYFAHDLEELLFSKELVQRGKLLIAGYFNTTRQEEELLVFVQHRSGAESFLPTYKAIIVALRESLGIEVTHVIPVKSISKTTSGKLQRFPLIKSYQNGHFSAIIEEINSLLCPKKTHIESVKFSEDELEHVIRKIWSDILRISEMEISIDDKFFALGGNSLKAFKLLEAVSNHVGFELDPEMLVLCRTIREIVSYLKSHHGLCQETECNEVLVSSQKGLDLDKTIAITGMALRLPGAVNPEEFWNILEEGTSKIAKVSKNRKKMSGEIEWDDWMGELGNIDYFDNEFFEINEEDAVFTDPQQRLILELAYQALEDAGVIPGLDSERNIGVYSGVSLNTYFELLVAYLKKNGVENVPSNALVGNLSNMISARISSTFNFTGPAVAIDTACSSFFVALHQAITALRGNEISGAVVAGANILATSKIHALSRKAGILSSTQFAQVFDKDASGTVLGEGVIVYYLETLKNAIQNDKNIYGVIRGIAVNNDGTSFGIMAPNPLGQFRVLTEAYEDADLSPGEIDYIEVHGTGTAIGDPIEFNVLKKLFSRYRDFNGNKIRLGSVKTNVGHLLAAAGGVGLAKVLLSFKNRKFAPSLHVNNISPALKIEDSPFWISRELAPWIRFKNQSRKAAISSFGFGGTNTHLVLEEWTDDRKVNTTLTPNLLTLSAKSEKSLKILVDQAEEYLKNSSDIDIQNFCFTRNRYRLHHTYRAALLISPDNKRLKNFTFNCFLSKKPFKKVCLIIGDLIPKNNQNANGIQFPDEIIRSVKNETANIESLNEDPVRFVSYWYLVLKALKDRLLSPLSILGTYSENTFVSALNEQKDFAEALRVDLLDLGRAKTKLENEEIFSNLKCDVFISVGTFENEFFDDDIFKEIPIIHLDEKILSSYDNQLLSLIGELYVLGIEIDWSKVHPDDSGKIISVPGYPFDSKPFWLTLEYTKSEEVGV